MPAADSSANYGSCRRHSRETAEELADQLEHQSDLFLYQKAAQLEFQLKVDSAAPVEVQAAELMLLCESAGQKIRQSIAGKGAASSGAASSATLVEADVDAQCA